MATKVETKPRLTAQQKRDRDFMSVLLKGQLDKQSIDLGTIHARELSEAKEKSFLQGFAAGDRVAVNKFAALNWWERLTWKANK